MAKNNDLSQFSAWSWHLAVGTLVVLLGSFLIRYANHSQAPLTDELYHILAAASWQDMGELRVADGAYDRGALFTILLGLVMEAWGESLDTIRVFCVVVGALLVSSVFAGTYAVVGRREAWVAAIILGLMPGAIFFSQYIRFYSLHATLFWWAAICAYLLYERTLSHPRRAALVGIGLASLAVSFHLQITTAIGVAGLLVWFVLASAPRFVAYLSTQGRSVHVGAMALLLAVVAGGILLLVGPFWYFIEIYRHAPLWSAGNRPLFYFDLFRDQFGLLWALFPAAAVIGLIAKPRPALFCICIFATAFVFHSFAGMQAERFIFYAMPFFCVIWGIAGAWLIPRLYGCLAASVQSVSQRSPARAGILASVVVAGLVGFAAASTPALEMTARMVAGKAVRAGENKFEYWSRYRTSWGDARAILQPLVGNADVLITSQGMHALYFFDRFGIELNATRLSDFSGEGQAAIDPRTGRLVIADSGSLIKLMRCHADGLLIVHDLGWRSAAIVPPALVDTIEGEMVRVAVPPEWGLHVFKWEGQGDLARSAVCGPMQELPVR